MYSKHEPKWVKKSKVDKPVSKYKPALVEKPIMTVAHFYKIAVECKVNVVVNGDNITVYDNKKKTVYKMCEMLTVFLEEIRSTDYVKYLEYNEGIEKVYMKQLEVLVRKEAIDKILKDLE